MVDETPEELLGTIREILDDFENIDFRPHELDRIEHANGAVTVFGKSLETMAGVIVHVHTTLPPVVRVVEIKGKVVLR